MGYTELKHRLERELEGVRGHVCLSFLNLETREGFDIRGDKKVPSASTIKLVILAELFRRGMEGSLSLEDEITVTAEMHTGGDGILKELRPGHRFTLHELATLMVIVSDNQATNILIDLLGMEQINAMAATLNLYQTVLGRRMMDSEARKQGRDNYISANDMARILTLMHQGELVDGSASAAMLDILKRQQQRGRLQLYLPEEVVVAHKCGDLDFLENDGGIIYLEGRPYVLVVLTSGMDSNKEGREVIGRLSRLVYDACSGELPVV